MSKKSLLPIIAISLLFSGQLDAQTPVEKHDQEARRPAPTLENEETRAKRKQSIEEVRSMSDRVLRFQNSEVKIRTTILLAEILWSRGLDEQGARPLFLKADDLIRSVRISQSDGPVASEKSRDIGAVSPSVLRNLKILLVQKVSAHDPPLGQRLGREYGFDSAGAPESESQSNYEVSELIRRGQLASATKSLQGKIDDNLSGMSPLIGFVKLLIALRAQDAQAADRIFVEATLRMSGRANVTANDILLIGNYLFASRHISEKALTDIRLFGTSMIQLGDVVVQADIAQVRPGFVADTALTYIGIATQALGRASYDPEEMKRRSLAAYLVLPHAKSFAPEFVPQLSSIQSRAGIDFSKPNRNSIPLTANGDVDLKALLEAVEAIPSSKLRDQFVLSTVLTLYRKGHLEAALAVAEKVSALTTRNELASVITFAQAVKSLEAGQAEMAQESLKKVTTSLQRCLLRFGLARQSLLQHDQVTAEALIKEAIDDIRDHGDELQKPYLILSAVQMLAPINLRAATDRFADAIKAFNALEQPRKARAGPIFWETISVSDSSALFPLTVTGVQYVTISLALRSLASDSKAVKAALFELKDEGMLSEGILALANSLLR